jgi:hypothetical protein
LIGLEDPLLVGCERRTIFLVRVSMEGSREHATIEAHAGFKEGV